MTFEEYESELDRRIKELDWKQEKARDRLETPAHDLMVQANRDTNVTLEQFEKLSRTFYGW